MTRDLLKKKSRRWWLLSSPIQPLEVNHQNDRSFWMVINPLLPHKQKDQPKGTETTTKKLRNPDLVKVLLWKNKSVMAEGNPSCPCLKWLVNQSGIYQQAVSQWILESFHLIVGQHMTQHTKWFMRVSSSTLKGV